jgi:uncharacterized protein
LGELLGGSQAYTVSRGGHATMLAHHFGKNISEAQRRRWVNLLLDSADEIGLPGDPEFRSALVAYLEWGSQLAVMNSKLPAETVADPATPMPHWSWGMPGWALRARARVASLRSAKSSRTHAGVTWVATWTGCTLEWQRLESPPMPPTFANGKICYIEMPATDIDRSSNFYKQVFGWNIRKRGDGSTSFDDTVGQVSGTWVLGRPPGVEPGLLFYVMVDRVASTIDAIVANGGEIVQPIGADAPEITARFRDPGGNVIGLYQQPA